MTTTKAIQIQYVKYAVGTLVLLQLLNPALAMANSTLQVEFSANPASGTAPLNNVDLIASVSGTATGPITYKFDCTNDGSWDKSVTTNSTSYTAVDLCDYSSPGNYLAKVSVGRGGLFFEGTTAIMVNVNQDLTVTLSATPSSGTAPLLDVDLKAVVSGSANEEITYRFDCTDDGTWERVYTTNNTSYTAVDLCDYEDAGSYTAKVKVIRGGLSFVGTTQVAVLSNSETDNAEVTLKITKLARNITRGENARKTEVSASPEDLIEFRIEVTASGETLEGVVLRDILPGQMTFAGNLKINGIANGGNIIDGLDLGKMNPGDTKLITFEARVKSAENFNFGSTTLINTSYVKANNGAISTSLAKITVTKTGVLGAASVVSTGITEYLYVLLLILFLLSIGLYIAWQRIERSQNKLAKVLVRKFYLWRSFVIPR